MKAEEARKLNNSVNNQLNEKTLLAIYKKIEELANQNIDVYFCQFLNDALIKRLTEDGYTVSKTKGRDYEGDPVDGYNIKW